MSRALRTVAALARATHLGPTLAVTALATALAAAVGVGARTAVVVALAALTGQLSVGWSNDWIDAGRDAAVGRADKPTVTGAVAPATLRTGAFVALGVCVPASLALGWRAGALHLAAVAAAWAYNLGLKATVWSWAPYAFAFGALPSVVTLTLPGHPVAQPWATGTGALLGVGAHLANVLPDFDDDAATGVRGLPHRLGRLATGALASVVLLGATALAVVGPAGPPSAWAWATLGAAAGLTVAGGVVALRRPRSRFPFTATIAIAVVDVALLLLAGADLVASPVG